MGLGLGMGVGALGIDERRDRFFREDGRGRAWSGLRRGRGRGREFAGL